MNVFGEMQEVRTERSTLRVIPRSTAWETGMSAILLIWAGVGAEG